MNKGVLVCLYMWAPVLEPYSWRMAVKGPSLTAGSSLPSKGVLWSNSTRPLTSTRCSAGTTPSRRSTRKLWRKVYPTPSSTSPRNSPWAARVGSSSSTGTPDDTPPPPSGNHTQEKKMIIIILAFDVLSEVCKVLPVSARARQKEQDEWMNYFNCMSCLQVAHPTKKLEDTSVILKSAFQYIAPPPPPTTNKGKIMISKKFNSIQFNSTLQQISFDADLLDCLIVCFVYIQ